MVKILPGILCLIVFQVNSENANAQLSVKLQGQSISIPFFRADSVAGSQNVFTKIGALDPITGTEALVEIRMYHRYVYPGTMGYINILKFYPDSAVYAKLSYENFWYADEDPQKLRDGQIDSIRLFTKDKFRRRQVYVGTPPVDILTSLVQSGLFEIADQTHLLDSLKKAGVQLADPCKDAIDCFSGATIFIEIKCGSYLRNFRLLRMNYYQYHNQFEFFRKQQAILSAIQRFIF